MKTKLPNVIDITITEDDRQKADYFDSNCDCLLATALKREGYKDIEEMVYTCRVDGQLYSHEYFGLNKIEERYPAPSRPFYLPSVVGLKIKLTRVDSK